jgi:predicted CopG family antitoxin
MLLITGMKSQKTSPSGQKSVALHPDTYDKLVDLARKNTSFNDVIMAILHACEKNGVVPNYEELEKN